MNILLQKFTSATRERGEKLLVLLSLRILLHFILLQLLKDCQRKLSGQFEILLFQVDA